MSQRQRILIIDDNKDIVAALSEFFALKYETLTAHNGIDGLQAFEQHEDGIDLVITDLMMPELSGVGVISILKKKYPGVRIIAITGWRDQFDGYQEDFGVDKVIDKPFDLGILDRAVGELLTTRGACPQSSVSASLH